jgi:hypothetical protein
VKIVLAFPITFVFLVDMFITSVILYSPVGISIFVMPELKAVFKYVVSSLALFPFAPNCFTLTVLFIIASFAINPFSN